MFLGIGPEAGHRILECHSFGYACDRCLTGTKEEQEQFVELARTCEDMDDFARTLVEWFYSGNWIQKDADKKYSYIIRFEDKKLRAFYGTYTEAVRSAREESEEKQGMGYIII